MGGQLLGILDWREWGRYRLVTYTIVFHERDDGHAAVADDLACLPLAILLLDEVYVPVINRTRGRRGQRQTTAAMAGCTCAHTSRWLRLTARFSRSDTVATLARLNTQMALDMLGNRKSPVRGHVRCLRRAWASYAVTDLFVLSPKM